MYFYLVNWKVWFMFSEEYARASPCMTYKKGHKMLQRNNIH